MKMKNFEISNVNYVLGQLIDEPLKGRFKFKVFAIKSELERCVQILANSLDGVTDEDERAEILDETQEVSIDFLNVEELEDIDLTMRQIGMLQPIIQFEEGEN